jgi:hypothetical protein
VHMHSRQEAAHAWEYQMTEDEREDLIYQLLEEFKQSVGSSFSVELKLGFISGARSALVTVDARLTPALSQADRP